MLDRSDSLDKAFHALADPTRRAMVDRLARGPASVSALAEPFEATLAAIVQHVQVLERAGLIETEKRGRTRTCRIAGSGFEQVEAWLTARRQLWERRFDALGALLAAPEEGPGASGDSGENP